MGNHRKVMGNTIHYLESQRITSNRWEINREQRSENHRSAEYRKSL